MYMYQSSLCACVLLSKYHLLTSKDVITSLKWLQIWYVASEVHTVPWLNASPQAQHEEEVLNLLISIKVKDKNCDFFKVYVYLVLTENWLLSNQLGEEKRVLNEMWRLYLRNCSCLIASTDLRSFASKVWTQT